MWIGAEKQSSTPAYATADSDRVNGESLLDAFITPWANRESNS